MNKRANKKPETFLKTVDPEPVLRLKDIHKRGEGDFALSNITFTQNKLENIAIAGETGAGKSTVLKLIAGLLQPDRGAYVRR